MPKKPKTNLYNSPKEKIKQSLAIPLYTNAMYLVADSVTTALLGFVFWIVVARFYSPADVGFATAAISIAIFLSALGCLGFDYSLYRFLPSTDRPSELINTSLTFCGIVCLLLGALFLFGLPIWSPNLSFIRGSVVFSLAFIILVVLLTLSVMAGSGFIARRQAKFAFFMNSVSVVLRIPLAILLVVFFHSFGIIAAYTLAMVVAVAIGVFAFLPRVVVGYKMLPQLKTTVIRNVWKYSSANYLAWLLFSASRWILPVLVLNILGPDANAYFYIAFTTASLLFLIPAAVSSSLFAEGSHFEDKLGENVIRSLKLTFLMLVPGVILVFLAGKWLLLLFGESYQANAFPVLLLISLSSLPLSINYIYSIVLRVTDRLKELIIIWGLTAIGVLGGSYLTIPILGINGVGYAMLGTHTLVTLYIFSTRKLAIPHS